MGLSWTAAAAAVLALTAALAAARELDPAACGARFDVQRDKIIRTEESRGMGARYLAELDVGARGECLRLCCETDACDVFVYEEKSPGSCYLFACGPPEDFRCKFTAHGNFSSGVLALARGQAEQQDSARLREHEQQLASLRSATPAPPPSSSTGAAPPPPAPRPPPTRPSPLPPTRRCSRYQFECHSGGECIAVYNACDGVPQCADGSDEAPELGCPPAAPAPPPPALPPARTPRPPRPQPHQPERDSSGMQSRIQQEPLEGGGSGLTGVGAGVGAEAGAGAGAGAGGERWPHRLALAQPHRYSVAAEAGAPHIFSHKGGLLQEPREESPPFAYADDAAPPPAWPRPVSPWNQQQTMMDGAWGGGGYARLEWPEPDPRRAWPVPPGPPPQPRPDPDIPVYIPQKTMPELPLAYGGGQHTLRDAPKKGPPPPERRPPPAPAPSPPAPPARDDSRPSSADSSDKPSKEKTVAAPASAAAAVGASAGAAGAAGAAEADIEVRRGAGVARRPHLLSDEHDGLSDRPPAAVLLLVLGVLMTAALALLAGCRARAARRRLRRGKSPLAHDADYLVNGMYL